MNSQNLSNLDWKLLTMEYTQRFRNTVPNPSEATLAAWALEDQRDEMILKYYLRKEIEEVPEITFTTEIKLK